jgi:hypothetical protein
MKRANAVDAAADAETSSVAAAVVVVSTFETALLDSADFVDAVVAS